MNDTDVARLYDENAEEEWSRLDTRRTEFAVTCMALDEHLPPPPAKILDVGSGPGRYAIRLAQLGTPFPFSISQQCLDLAAKQAALSGVAFDAMVWYRHRPRPVPDGVFRCGSALGPALSSEVC